MLWEITKGITSLTWESSKFIVKNTPAALGLAWEVKKGISEAIGEGIQEYQKIQKKHELEEQIKLLKKD